MVKKCRLPSLVPICGNAFEHLSFNTVFQYYIDNEIFTCCQSKFLAADSCTQQLILAIDKMEKPCYSNLKLRVSSIFWDISKFFFKCSMMVYDIKTQPSWNWWWIITVNLLFLDQLTWKSYSNLVRPHISARLIQISLKDQFGCLHFSFCILMIFQVKDSVSLNYLLTILHYFL